MYDKQCEQHKELIIAINHLGQVSNNLSVQQKSAYKQAIDVIDKNDSYTNSKTPTNYAKLKKTGAEFLVTHKSLTLTQLEYNKAVMTRDKLSTQYKLSYSINNPSLANEGLLIFLASVQSI